MGNRCSCCNGNLVIGRYILLGNNIALCEDCMDKAENAYQVLRSSRAVEETNVVHADGSIMKPTELKHVLDRYVVGQDKAKRILAVAVYNHYKRIQLNDDGIKKSNVLMVGPTGSGKTYIVQIMAKALNVPLAIADATTLTEAGYIGEDVETVVGKLLHAAGGDVAKAEQGIIFIDEIDKLSSVQSDTEKKVGGKGVQQALLKLLEGTKVEVSMSQKDGPLGNGFKTTVDTSNILFICGGAFPDLENVIRKRITKKNSMGFGSFIASEEDKEAIDKDILLNVTTDDLRQFGLIPEFLGRLPIIAALEELTVDTLKQILSEPEDSLLSQYKKLLAYDEVDLVFTDDAITAVAKKAFDKKIGARSLRAIMEEVLLDVMFGVPENNEIGKVIITDGVVNEGAQPRIIMRNEVPVGLESSGVALRAGK